jgi:hypothetical protein
MKKLLALVVLLASCSPASEPPVEEPPPPKPAPAPPPVAAGLAYETPKEWTSEKPTVTFGKAQWTIADKDKSEGNATLVYFGTMGGSIDQNVDRWRGQVRQPDGEPKTETLKAGDHSITLFDASGEIQPSTTLDPMKDSRMIGAIIETGGGNHYFKMWGPRGTVGDWRDAFVEMLKSARAK